MTEAEWLYGDNLQAKVHYLGQGYSFRKARLFAVACGRAASWSDQPALRRVLDGLERLADNPRRADRAALYRAFRQASDLLATGFFTPDEFAAEGVEWSFRAAPDRVMNIAVAFCAQEESRIATEARRRDFDWHPDPAEQYAIEQVVLRQYEPFLHDIVGNPFQAVRWQRAWRTADVLGVARSIYEESAFDRLPVLADALMDAGCEDEQVIGHCRGDGPHVRGCWVVDLALGKK
jgi:hypothetical protein